MYLCVYFISTPLEVIYSFNSRCPGQSQSCQKELNLELDLAVVVVNYKEKMHSEIALTVQIE